MQFPVSRTLPTTSNQADETNQRWSAGWPAAAGETLLIVMIFFCLAGDPPPAVNEAHYLSRCRHWWNPEWCAGDFFLESQEAHPLFVASCGWLTKFCSLSAAAWIGRLATWLAIAAAWRRLCWLIIPQRGAAVLSAAVMAVLIPRTEFAGEWLIGGFEAKGVAYALVLFGLGSALGNNWNRAWLALGAGSAYHAVVGGWSTLLLFAEWVLWRRCWNGFRKMTLGLVGGGLLALLGVLPALRLAASAPVEVELEANAVYVFDRLPHHLAPLSEPAEWLAERIPRHIVGLALFASGLVTMRRLMRRNEFDGIDVDRLWQMCRFAVLALGLSVIGLTIEAMLSAKSQLLAAAILKYYWFRLADVAVPWASALVWTAIAVALVRQRRLGGLTLLVVMLALIGYGIGKPAIGRMRAPIAPADRGVLDPEAWQDVCEWARTETEPQALFLTPRSGVSFKWRAERPEVVNYKDIPQSAVDIVEWRRRVRAIYGGVDPFGAPLLVGDLGELGGQHVANVGREFNADYAIAGAWNPLSLPVAYRNRAYVVYDLRKLPTPE